MSVRFLRILASVTTSFALPGLAIAASPARSQVATLTRAQGRITLLTRRGSAGSEGSAAAGGVPCRFEGIDYTCRDAKPGDRAESGTVVRVWPGSKARWIYPNGDVIEVAPGTGYRLEWRDHPELQLMLGRLRCQFAKGGPRTGFRIRTKTAVLGVRGTDFEVIDRGAAGISLAVFRGAVQLETNEPKPHRTEVKSGHTFSIESPEGAAAPKVMSYRTTSAELRAMQALSRFDGAPSSGELGHLETAAVENVVHDIEAYQPELKGALEKGKPATLEDVDQAVIPAKAENAPSRVESESTGWSADKAYQKYFR